MEEEGGTVDVINETALQRQTREHFARTLEKLRMNSSPN
ncbi:WSSV019 [White spot syndrome virus]|uniref:WSSV019 n=1 Tax=White spot syndrome virus TaxID=342409 RepID=A0A2I6SBF3_9VIRU|nr:WSSV019 [White spot syndrome virus]